MEVMQVYIMHDSRNKPSRPQNTIKRVRPTICAIEMREGNRYQNIQDNLRPWTHERCQAPTIRPQL